MNCSNRATPTLLAITFLAMGSISHGQDADRRAPTNTVLLSAGWKIQSAVQVKSKGKEISSSAFEPAGWYSSSVPGTVLAALVKNGVYRDIYLGTNLATIPTKPFQGAWWYRREFDLAADQAAQDADLVFEGINYRANIWFNGECLATADRTFGAFRMFSVNVSGRLKPGKNVVAVEVFPPKPGDFTLGFVDWNPRPPDGNMGLFRPVKLHLFKAIALEHLFVESQIDHNTWQHAELTLHADLINHSDKPVQSTLEAGIGGIHFTENLTMQPGEKRAVTLTPGQHPELKLDRPRLWWPWELGEPELYTLAMAVRTDAGIADAAETRFGIREVTDYLTAQGHRGYQVNGRRILIRGGGWADELLLDEDTQNLQAQVRYTKAMNLNTIRLEGVWGSSQQLYNLADENGLLMMVGWSCQWEWPEYLGKKCDDFGGIRSAADMDLAINYLRDQVLWLRPHPGILAWVLGSDMLPRPELEKRYDALLAALDPTRPTLKSCSDKTSTVSGPTGVKMNGPYDYVTPNYWYLDRTNGGAFGFNTETGPGPQPPPLESLERMIPANQLWPINSTWNFHCGRNEFNKLDRYLRAFNQRYGDARNVEEFAYKSQAANYEAIRSMYEAFSANLPATTGIIQWMLNPSWPKLYWQLYDYYLLPGGAFFGAMKGARPVSIIYNYGDHGVYLVNDLDQPQNKLQAVIQAYDLNSKTIFSTNVTSDCPAYGTRKIADLSTLSPVTPVFFLDLNVNAAWKNLADNFYWLSTKPDVLDEGKTEWFVTPNKSFADFTALDRLPEAHVRAQTVFKPGTDATEAEVVLSNVSDHLAFFIEMTVVDSKSKQALTPVMWSDNYVSLPPGANRAYQVRLPTVPEGAQPTVQFRGWNVKFDTATRTDPL